MLFFLKKTLTFWVLPLPLCLSLLGAGFVLGHKTDARRRLGRGLMLCGLLGLLGFSYKAVSRCLILPLESRYAPIPELAQPPPPALAGCQVIVVLGGGHGGSHGPLPACSKLSDSALGRLVEGVRLARLLPQSILVVSGPSDGAGGETHASVLTAAACSLGLPPQRVRQIDQARDTEEEAEAVARLFPKHKIALVSSAWHMPRSAALFHRDFPDLVACPADFRGKVAGHFNWRDYGWDSESLTRSTMALREYLGLFWLKLRGRI
jgi:uncharacterized SAM-binding protein YcdF (DUF218 family)